MTHRRGFRLQLRKARRLLLCKEIYFNRFAERRKLVSSIKSSVIDPKDDEVSYEEREHSARNAGLASSGDDGINEESDNDIRSSSYVHSTANEVPETLSPANRSFGKGKKEPRKNLTHEKASLDINFPKQLKDTCRKTVWSDKLPSIIPNSSKVSSVNGEKHELFKEITLQELDSEVNGPIIEDVKYPPLARANVMNVILVAAECAPWSKIGGLGDVAGALPKALARRGHRVMVVAPRYGNYNEFNDTGVRKRYKVDGQDVEVSYFQTYIDGVDFVFIESPMFRHINNNIYGGKREDILKCMVLFCKAAVEYQLKFKNPNRQGDGNLQWKVWSQAV